MWPRLWKLPIFYKFTHICLEREKIPRSFRFWFPVFFFFGFQNVTKDDLNRRFVRSSGTRAPPRGGRAASQQREQEIEKKNGGARENLSCVFALPCQLHAENVVSREAVHLPLCTYSGFRWSYDSLGCHGGRKNSTTSMRVSPLTC